MALYLSYDPTTEIGTEESKFSCVHHPIGWGFVRGDLGSIIVQNNAGSMQLFSTIAGQFSIFNTGDVIGVVLYTISGGKYVVNKSYTLEITNKIDDETIVIDTAYTLAFGSSAFVNDLTRTNHYAELDIKWLETLPSTYNVIGTLFNRENTNYLHSFKLNPILKNKCEYYEANNGLVVSRLTRENSGRYLVTIREYYNGSLQATQNLTDEFRYNNSVKQLGDTYGFNQAESVIFGAENTIKAKLLSAFEVPTFFKSFPFVTSILSERVTTYDIVKKYYNENGTLTTADVVNIVPSSTDIGLIRYNLPTDTNTNASAQMKVLLRDEANDYDLTQELTIDIDNDCKTNKVYIQWLAKDGSVNCWLFDKVQELATTVETGETFEPYVDDLTTQIGDVYELEKQQGDIMQVGCEVSLSKAQGLKTLPASLNILMLTNNDTWETDGVKWKKVRIQSGTFKMGRTDENNVVIQFTVILPKTNLQSL